MYTYFVAYEIENKDGTRAIGNSICETLGKINHNYLKKIEEELEGIEGCKVVITNFILLEGE